MKKAMSFVLAIILTVCTCILASAAAPTTVENLESITLSGGSIPQTTPYDENIAMIVESTTAERPPNSPVTVEVPMPRIVNDTGTRTIAAGSNYTKTFNMSNGGGIPHNAFNVLVTNPTAKYTLIISYDGIEIWNQQYNAVGASTTTYPCSVGQNFKVMVINDSSSSMTAQIAITSYIK